jgi:FkbM family methyltransferase
VAEGAEARPLPLPLRAWLATGLAGRERARGFTTKLARRLLRDEPYRTPDGFVLRVDAADPIMQTQMVLGLFDPQIEAIVGRYARPGTVAVDAGAHIGFVSMLLARAVGEGGRVESFECDPRIVPRLREHVALNGFGERIEVNERAVWNADGDELEMKLAEIPGLSYVDDGMWEPVATASVPTVTLDAHLARRGVAPEAISFIKLDVEGAEPEALDGLAGTLAATGAALLMEFQEWSMQAHPGRREQLLETVGGHGYEPYTPTLGTDGELTLVPGAVPSIGEDVLFLKG